MSRNKQLKSVHHQVEETKELLPFLFDVLPDTGRNSVKAILKRGQVLVNDKTETQHNYVLKPGQKVTIVKNKVARRTSTLKGLTIVYEDQEVLVVDKSSGLLSVASPKEKQLTAYRQLMNYVRQQNPNNRIFIVHRLDRDTSGVMMFAKSEQVKEKLQNTWKKSVTERTYIALVQGNVKKDKGTIESYLKESKSWKVHSSNKPNGGQHAVTHYEVLQRKGKGSLLKVSLETGRKNQIRVHMQELGHPIVGDEKYGASDNPIKRLGLHAHVLEFKHPKNGKIMRFESPIPSAFYKTLR
ncbi:RluA family pseudouridine synthase [Halobacillus fulvus]|nr:RluA family pseudouridine synthase [Halobacillus fulvus]